MQVFGIVGWKNNGKTTLVERLVAGFTAAGYRVSTVKHAHHEVDLDQPGKDSWRHREAGAREVVLATARRWAVIHELREEPEPPLDALLARMTPVDLVIVEQANKLLLNLVLILGRSAGSRRVAFWGHGKDFQAARSNRWRDRV